MDTEAVRDCHAGSAESSIALAMALSVATVGPLVRLSIPGWAQPRKT
jgi:hypothetical protein